jgi:hypothetical protein
MAEEKQDGQKTLVAFVVGLLIGGMLVWAFSGPSADAPTMSEENSSEETTTEDGNEAGEETSSESTSETNGGSNGSETAETPQLEVGDGEVVVTDQEAGMSVTLESAVYPVSEGWIGVRDYNNEELGLIKGVARFSESDGLVPAEIILQAPTVAGMTYAIVIFTEDGDRDFSLAGDVQIDTIYDTFTAQ